MIVANHYTITSPGGNYAKIISDDGNLISAHTFMEAAYASDYNGTVVAENGDIYIAGRWQDRILRMDKDCNILVNLRGAEYIIAIAIAPDGYIWSSEISVITGNAWFVKRDPITLQQEDFCHGYGSISAYAGLIFDSDGFLYTVDWVSDEIEKLNVVTKTRVDTRAISLILAPILVELRIRDTTLYLTEPSSHDVGDYFTCPIDLSEDFTAHELVEFDQHPPPGDPDAGFWANHIVQLGTTGWIVMGVINRETYVIRYDNDFTKIWDYHIEAVPPDEYGYSLGVGWYESVTYDFPIYPVIFPLRT